MNQSKLPLHSALKKKNMATKKGHTKVTHFKKPLAVWIQLILLCLGTVCFITDLQNDGSGNCIIFSLKKCFILFNIYSHNIFYNILSTYY